jgi:hypothetical protein
MLGAARRVSEKINTMTRQASIPAMIEAPHSEPGAISLGAIQHLTPFDSRTAQAALAHGLSLLE